MKQSEERMPFIVMYSIVSLGIFCPIICSLILPIIVPIIYFNEIELWKEWGKIVSFHFSMLIYCVFTLTILGLNFIIQINFSTVDSYFVNGLILGFTVFSGFTIVTFYLIWTVSCLKKVIEVIKGKDTYFLGDFVGPAVF